MNKSLIIGETCLLGKQLRRIGIIDGPSNMFDDVLVNLDSVKSIIDNNFQDILSEDNLKFIDYMFYPDHNIHYSKWINTFYSITSSNVYSWPVYAPLFHHDNATIADHESYYRKIERTKQTLEDTTINTTLFYYHRYHSNSDIAVITRKFILFIEFLNHKYNKQFKGVIITNNTCDAKNIDASMLTRDIVHAHFTTTDSWIGIDDNWDAHTDNDLFDQFFNSEIYKNILKED